MKICFKIALVLLFIVAAAITMAFYFINDPVVFNRQAHARNIQSNDGTREQTLLEKLHRKSESLKLFLEKNHYNAGYCFMIDMSIAPGHERFFVYNIIKDSIEAKGLVAHGQGSGKTDAIEFSNEPGSYCSSLGKYKIGGAYDGRFGLAYKLYGLDSSNSKALERFVVLHSHSCVPGEDVYPLSICESQGCPTVSPVFLGILSGYIKRSAQPVLLYLYE